MSLILFTSLLRKLEGWKAFLVLFSRPPFLSNKKEMHFFLFLSFQSTRLILLWVMGKFLNLAPLKIAKTLLSINFMRQFRENSPLCLHLLVVSMGPFKYYIIKEVGGVRKWQFMMIYSTVNHQRGWWVGLKKWKTWWRNTWMVPYQKLMISAFFLKLRICALYSKVCH